MTGLSCFEVDGLVYAAAQKGWNIYRNDPKFSDR